MRGQVTPFADLGYIRGMATDGSQSPSGSDERRSVQFEPGEVISYLDMCRAEGTSLQAGMNFQLGGSYSVFLMSRRSNAPYDDEVRENGTVIIYEGHDAPRSAHVRDPKVVDQPLLTTSGKLTQNGLFFEAAQSADVYYVRVYEKLHQGVWVFNGTFRLTDAWQTQVNGRIVFKFQLESTNEIVTRSPTSRMLQRERTRVIPSSVKQAVWRRDHGRCVLCGSTENLHFDHDLPFSRGGSSTVENIRILCARHNIEKRDRIE